jgi:hypothetical protein
MYSVTQIDWDINKLTTDLTTDLIFWLECLLKVFSTFIKVMVRIGIAEHGRLGGIKIPQILDMFVC